MDGSTFDRLTVTLTGTGSRRRALGALLAGELALLGAGSEDTRAHDLKAKCKKLKGDKKKKCLKKAKKHKVKHAKETPAPVIPPECGTPEECPTPQGLCRFATCIGGRCGVANRAAGDPCDDGLFCNGGETCDGNGNCQAGTPPCDDSIACTDDSCDEATDTCEHTPNHTACVTTNPCLVGQCDPSAPNADQHGCVFTPFTGGTITCGIGACQRTVQQCINGQEQACVPGQPSPETCNGLDDDCDGIVDNGFNLQTDVRNCGRCGKECSFPHARARCVSGTCQIDTCDPGFANCSPSTEDGCETELGTRENCSFCGDVCDAPPNGTTTCESGVGPGPGECVYTCDPGFEQCLVDGRIACCSTSPIDFCRLQFPASMTVSRSQMSDFIYGRIYEGGVTDGPGESGTITAHVGYGPAGTDPRSASSWRYQPAAFFTDDGNEDEYRGTFTAPSTAGIYAYVYRFSLDGGNTWTYCDLDGNSGNSTTDFDANNLGVMTVE